MAFKRVSGDPRIEYYPKAASTVFHANGLVYADGSGHIIPADATSGQHLGIILVPVTATDSDYASNTKVPVDVPDPNDIFEVDVETGTLTTSMIGNQYDLVADGDAIDVSASLKGVVTIVGYISPTKALVKINAMIGVEDVPTT